MTHGINSMHMWGDCVRIWEALLYLDLFGLRTAQLVPTLGFQSNRTTLTVACALLSSLKVGKKIVNFTNGTSSYRMELMLDIICGPHNALVHQLVSLLSEMVKPVRRNAPRNKKKNVSSPYTAPSTRSLIECAEGLPKGAMRKGRKKLLT
ncbi:uncharacterized protein [Arachis hypogaea]|uniref:uncharacterized protein n=1 Tax=Arachis hypogaea TaxID=3818 RepID=UPI000DED88DD|nr:uncharacterized protein LOC112779788 [Arachis hypogaea]XP_025679920.1 uncharacterized protein LOC112779788 [Arachis hypogaea]XP_025679921.1 uncharacterized protein LOC112779788 [Arachis hypogaea]